MILARRVLRMERNRPRRRECTSCGGMRRVELGGPIRSATLLRHVDDRVLAVCKVCGGCYDGTLLDAQATGAVRLRGVRAGEIPV